MLPPLVTKTWSVPRNLSPMPTEVRNSVSNGCGSPSTDRSPVPRHRAFVCGQHLYREGDSRMGVFEVLSGSIALSRQLLGRTSVVQVAGPGEYIGLGFLDHRPETAQAITDSVVNTLTDEDVSRLAEIDLSFRAKQADAVSREFAYRKTMLARRGQFTVAECLASFLIAVSRQNKHEGRDPAIVTETFTCGAVARLLGISIDELARALILLKTCGLIDDIAGGSLHIKSVEALEAVAIGARPGV